MTHGFLRRDWWMRRNAPPAEGPQRWVVIDCETSGLDPKTDELLAAAGVAVQIDGASAQIMPEDSFEVLVRPIQVSNDDNVLIHGIGRAAQQGGQDPVRALTAFAAWVADAPVVAFHAPFDRAFIQRACSRVQVMPPARNWLDLAQLVPALYPDRRARTLDDWLAHFGISAHARHCAAGDALTTAMLLALVLPTAWRQGARTIEAMRRTANAMRWMQP